MLSLWTVIVFPARAGMSPPHAPKTTKMACVPRASGDEPPYAEFDDDDYLCSPRERG